MHYMLAPQTGKMELSWVGSPYGHPVLLLQEFGRLAHDGLLLEGKVEEYEKAFSGVDVDDQGVISKVGKLDALKKTKLEWSHQSLFRL